MASGRLPDARRKAPAQPVRLPDRFRAWFQRQAVDPCRLPLSGQFHNAHRKAIAKSARHPHPSQDDYPMVIGRYRSRSRPMDGFHCLAAGTTRLRTGRARMKIVKRQRSRNG